eukprot:SAG22_NODE_390_length_11235_cov_26.293732_4_plen_126_part_00
MLERCSADPGFVIGCIGDLDPFSDRFDDDLALVSADGRFVGFRLTCHAGGGGRPYTGAPRDFLDGSSVTPRLVRSLEALTAAGLVLDVHTGYPYTFVHALLAAVPDLRVVINHLGELRPLVRTSA